MTLDNGRLGKLVNLWLGKCHRSKTRCTTPLSNNAVRVYRWESSAFIGSIGPEYEISDVHCPACKTVLVPRNPKREGHTLHLWLAKQALQYALQCFQGHLFDQGVVTLSL